MVFKKGVNFLELPSTPPVDLNSVNCCFFSIWYSSIYIIVSSSLSSSSNKVAASRDMP
uniref:Uncharacterized protein n=1 Tax=Arundo donax TaxID=35708 RepID=A0A0A9A872_ARUDO